MRGRRVLTAMVVGLMIGAGSASAQTVKPLTGQDYYEIWQLIGMYNQGSDLRDADMWLSIWTPDASFQIGTGKPMVGTKELTAFRMNSFKTRKAESKPRHWDNALVLTPTAEGATGRMYYVTYETNGKVPVLMNSGYYDDVFVRTPAGWKITKRIVHFDAPPVAPPAPSTR